MTDCIFCKIIKGDLNSYTIFEDDKFKAFLDILPSNHGHTLIVPKVHVENIFEIDESYTALPLIKKVAKALKEITGCTGINILQNNGADAGQTIFHYHIHVIPRYEYDKIRMNPPFIDPKPTEKDFIDMAEKLQKKL